MYMHPCISASVSLCVFTVHAVMCAYASPCECVALKAFSPYLSMRIRVHKLSLRALIPHIKRYQQPLDASTELSIKEPLISNRQPSSQGNGT